MVQPINTQRAHKAINLATELSNAQKQVLGALVDHYNQKTGQCDPSLDCLAELIVISRRTVIRAINGVEKFGFICRDRHGGKFHRNSYKIIWSRLHQVEAEWNGRRGARSARHGAPKVSPYLSQPRHLGGDTADTQTSSSNLLKETLAEQPLSSKTQPTCSPKEKSGSAKEAAPRKISSDVPYISRSGAASSVTAARDAAERRWNNELLNRYSGKPGLYGQIVDAVDDDIIRATTDAELRHRGSGASYLIHEMLARDAAFKTSAVRRVDDPGGIKTSGP